VSEADDSPRPLAGQTALVTGGARRIGAHLVRALHTAGADVVIHYHRSEGDAQALTRALDDQRCGSATPVAADLRAPPACGNAVAAAHAWAGRLDIVVNNASSFYATPVGAIDEPGFDDLMGTNLRAPTFIAQAAAPLLADDGGGAIVNIADIHGQRPCRDHPVYCAAKAGLISLTQALARDLAPHVRVNAIAPGSILWPENAHGADPAARAAMLEATPLGRQGTPDDLAKALIYLVAHAPFVTGQTLPIDGGRGL